MIPIPAGCARFLCYGWIITGVCFVLGMHKGGEDLSGAGLMMLCCGVVAVLTYGVAGLIQRQRRNRAALASQ